jgi:hypothetical protein
LVDRGHTTEVAEFSENAEWVFGHGGDLARLLRALGELRDLGGRWSRDTRTKP